MYKYSFPEDPSWSSVLKWTRDWISKDIPFHQTIFTRPPLHFFLFPLFVSLSLSMSSKAHYLLRSLIDYKCSVLFLRNMPLRGLNIPPDESIDDKEKTWKGSRKDLSFSHWQNEKPLSSLLFLSLILYFTFPPTSFVSIFFTFSILSYSYRSSAIFTFPCISYCIDV